MDGIKNSEIKNKLKGDKIMEEQDYLKPITSDLVRKKFEIRSITQSMNSIYDQIRLLKREKNILIHQNNPFNKHRIEGINKEQSKNNQLINQLEKRLKSCGKFLMAMFPIYDSISSIHDKSQLINIHHSQLEKIIQNSAKKDDSMVSLCFIYNAEVRHNEDFLSLTDIDTPFRNAIVASMLKAFEEPEMVKVQEKIFQEFFPDVPLHHLYEDHLGNQIYEKQYRQPKLTVISGKANT
ncbi:MAG: hypothetical protein HOD92_20085 [Deltaproteobacteria bacterium]|jgi:hypothetical protein|nr:hypothetical protein [Deltaproteobacteria bacterium]